jgi:hypothetical protein
MTEPPLQVVVRRRWNDADSGTTELQHLREPVFKNVPGGICGPLPRPFLFARVWCEHLIDGAALHDCDLDTAPHELELCVLERDNPGAVYAALRRATRR